MGDVGMLYRLYIGIADGMSVARVWVRGGHFEYQHAHTCAMDMPSAMSI